MKQKKCVIAVIIIVAVIVAGSAFFRSSSKWSEKSFEAVIVKTVTQPDGEVRLIVERTTERYANPLNALHISERTSLVDIKGKTKKQTDFRAGDSVKVTLKDSFVEETPFYYPTVYEIREIGTNL